MTELLLPRLKQEIETRLAELRPLIAEIEQLEAAKAALLARAELPTAVPAPAPARRRAQRNGSATRRRAAAAPQRAERDEGDGERAPRGANRDAIVKLVEERPGVSVAEIASVTKIAKPTVATTVSKLKREGVFADEAGGVKLASRQAMTISGEPAEAPEPEALEPEAPAAEAVASAEVSAPAGAALSADDEAAAEATAAPAARPARRTRRGGKRRAARRARAAAQSHVAASSKVAGSAPRRDEGASDDEWDAAAPAAGEDAAS
jgi:hypothetical protein